MRITKSTIPAGSLVEKYLPADYTDAFSCEVAAGDGSAARKLTPDDIMVAFWTRTVSAGWVGALFRLRDFLVQFVGLKGSDDMNPAAFEAVIRGGGSYGLMSITAKSPHETVMLLSDKHLDAWLSVHVTDAGAADEDGKARKTVSVITVVKFKNRLGRVYFFVIRPFHNIVVKSMLRRAVKPWAATK